MRAFAGMSGGEFVVIDIFNHFMPKAYLDRLGALIPGHVVLTAFPRLKTLWDVDARLALLRSPHLTDAGAPRIGHGQNKHLVGAQPPSKPSKPVVWGVLRVLRVQVT